MRMVKFSKSVRFPQPPHEEIGIDCWWRENITVTLYTDSSNEESLKAINYLERQIKKIEEEHQDE